MSAFFLAITIIGLPLAYANVKLVPVSLWPFGRDVVLAGQLTTVPGGVAVRAPQLRR